jgi:hypothetical protein
MVTLIESLTRKLLDGAHTLPWQVQGLGMLRTYLSKEVRLHIWHSDFIVPNVSTIHTHPWGFHSDVVVGTIWNYKYLTSPIGEATHTRSRLRCGVGGGLDDKSPKDYRLNLLSAFSYTPGQEYSQKASDIHETKARDGTLTLIRRTFLDDPEHADVFWPVGTQWVSAEPRAATKAEVEKGVSAAMTLLDAK